MDKRDPVVMQAIANVIGTRTMDAGCLGPPPGQTQAIYDEIKRLDRARLEAEHRRTVEIQADLMTSIDVAVLPASASTSGVINMAAAVCEPSASILDGRRREAATLVPSAPMTSLNGSSPICSPVKHSRPHRQPVSAA